MKSFRLIKIKTQCIIDDVNSLTVGRYMSKKSECTICKHYGKQTPKGETLETAQLYDDNGAPVPIALCRTHSVQLFKLGQKSFLLSHYRILADLMDTDEKKFINLLDRTVRKFPDLIR